MKQAHLSRSSTLPVPTEQDLAKLSSPDVDTWSPEILKKMPNAFSPELRELAEEAMSTTDFGRKEELVAKLKADNPKAGDALGNYLSYKHMLLHNGW